MRYEWDTTLTMVAYSLTALMVITSYPWFGFHAAVIANVFFSLHDVLSVIASVCWCDYSKLNCMTEFFELVT